MYHGLCKKVTFLKIDSKNSGKLEALLDILNEKDALKTFATSEDGDNSINAMRDRLKKIFGVIPSRIKKSQYSLLLVVLTKVHKKGESFDLFGVVFAKVLMSISCFYDTSEYGRTFEQIYDQFSKVVKKLEPDLYNYYTEQMNKYGHPKEFINYFAKLKLLPESFDEKCELHRYQYTELKKTAKS